MRHTGQSGGAAERHGADKPAERRDRPQQPAQPAGMGLAPHEEGVDTCRDCIAVALAAIVVAALACVALPVTS